jgi:hypothetical protein
MAEPGNQNKTGLTGLRMIQTAHRGFEESRTILFILSQLLERVERIESGKQEKRFDSWMGRRERCSGGL